MQQNEKIKKELQALRKENARLKAELSKISLQPSEKELYAKQTLQTENHLRSFFEKIGLGAWEYKANHSGAYLSKKIIKFTNLKNKDGIVEGVDFFKIIHFQDVERVRMSFQKVVDGESPIYDCMYRMLSKNNQYVWILSRGIPIFDNKAKVYKIIGCMEDLSESKRYNVVKERLNFMQRIADALPIPIYYKDMNGCYVGHNEAFKEFVTNVGTRSSTLIGSDISDIHNSNNQKAGAELVRDEKAFLANPGKSFEKTYTLTSASGEKRYVINKKSLLHDPQGNPKFLVGGILDITEHERVKSEARIHQEQLLLADKMKSLGILISGVAHEINNPNNFININVMLLQKMWEDLKPLFYDKMKNSPDFKLGKIPGYKLEESMDDLLFGIKDGSERISKIIESLKDYIRNAPSNIKETFDLHDAIENVTFLLKNQMMKATDKFTINRKNKKLPVKGVQQQIEQVIINVLQNACQALTSREQSIQIETTVDSSGKFAIIKIIDDGIGIDSKHLNFIADPFFTTRREIGGTGLGLSISSSILEEHKGRFNFGSELDKGTIVEIILPLALK
jgi:PAS domain S-box-containing protein